MTDTNKTTKEIINYITALGGYAKRINTSGVRGRRSPYKGHPDIDAMIDGRGFKVEVKTGKDRLSDVQEKFIAEYERAGGKVFVVGSLEDFINELNYYLK